MHASDLDRKLDHIHEMLHAQSAVLKDHGQILCKILEAQTNGQSPEVVEAIAALRSSSDALALAVALNKPT